MFKTIQARVQALRDNALAYGPVRFWARVFTEFARDNCSTLAAGIAYYAFLSVFPLLLALIGLFGLFLPQESIKDQIFNFFSTNLPGASDFIRNNVENVIRMRGTFGLIGIAGLLLTGSGLLGAVGSAINQAWDIHKEMPFYWKKLRDIGLSVGLAILFFLVLGTGTIAVIPRLGDISLVGGALAQVGLRLISFLLSLCIFLVLFKVMPNTRTYWRHIWWGAVLTAFLFEVGRNLLIIYFARFTSYELIYGSIGSIVILLVWIYYSGLILLLGTEFTAEYGRMRRGINRGVHSHSLAQPGKA